MKSSETILKNKNSMLITYAIICIICASLSVASLVLLIVLSKNSREVLSFTFFSGFISVFYIITSIYHFFPFRYRRKKVFFKLSHVFFIMSIWGIYMPYSLVLLNNALGWTIFGIITALAIIGIVLRSIYSYRWSGASESVYYFLINWFWVISVFSVLPKIGQSKLMFYFIAFAILNLAMVFYKLAMYQVYKRYTLFMPMFYFLLILANSFHILFMFRYLLK